jgi:glycerol-3-phosphate dehydrogenase subunit B
MKHYDVIVIGMGLTGLMAAKTAVERGKSVLLIGKGVGTAHTYTGCIDVLGYYPAASSVPVENPLESLNRLIEEIPNHPYARVGVSDIRKAITSFLGLFAEGGYHYLSQGDQNAITLTPMGSTRGTYLFPSTMEWGGIKDEREILIVGFHGLKDFYSAYIAHNINSLRKEGRLSFGARSTSLPLSELSRRTTAPSSVLARSFEEEGFLDKIAEVIRAERKEGERVAFPAVLGIEKPQEVKKELEEKLGTTVFEIPTLPPSVPGFRLFQAFKRDLQRNGVTMITGFSAGEALVRDGRCLQVTITSPPIERIYSAEVYVLATGSFFGGGLEVKGDRVVEPLFDLPVHQPVSREHWFRDRFLSDEAHPIESFGIMVDERLNPLDEEGRVVVRNLHAAGSILSHCDALREKSGGGVALSTGYKSVVGEFH